MTQTPVRRRLLAALLSGSIRIASRFDHEKHFAAASAYGSHAYARCSRGSSTTAIGSETSRPNTCSVLWVMPCA